MFSSLPAQAGRATYHQHSSGESGRSYEGGVGSTGGGDVGVGETTDAADVQLRSEVRNIMENVVTASSAKRYTNGIVNFFLWLFDDSHLHHLFKDWFLVNLITGHAVDQSLPETKRDGRKNIRSTIKSALSSIVGQDCSTHPLSFQFLNFDIFSRYLTSRKKTIVVKKTTDEVEVEEEVEVYLGKSSYDGIRSSIMHLYRICNVEMDKDFQKSLTIYIAGIKRVVAQEKKETGQKLSEGKRDMPLKVSCFLFLIIVLFYLTLFLLHTGI